MQRVLQVKRGVRMRDAAADLRKEQRRSRVLVPTEFKRRQRTALDGTTTTASDPRSEEAAADHQTSDEPDVVEVPDAANVGDFWEQALLAEAAEEHVEDDSEDEADEADDVDISTAALAGELAAYEHSTGDEYRQANPFPAGDGDVKKWPQEKKPPGARSWKMRISDMFPPLVPLADQLESLPSCLLPTLE
eukprot:GHVU01110798.1.p2 GENE.GHVU01110798.1~~GHVU01110798.1.p2  ORF type:complete len:191 (+),score=46.24 GHVU01110798.1:192-764(+)